MTVGDLFKLVVIAVAVASLPIGGCMYGYPQYQIYSARMAGEAELAQANYSKQVQVQDAIAKKDSAQALADAEVIRAQGVANANKIVSEGLGGPEGYLRYLWINKLSESEGKGGQVVYVPTEAGLPILEANRLKATK